MNIDEIELRPFDLEAAKRGEKVLAPVYNGTTELAPVIESTWTQDVQKRTSVLIQFKDGDTEWRARRFDELRMAPKTRTVWYGLFRKYGILSTSSPFSSEEKLRQKAKKQYFEILAIHSMEVEE